jgi:NAD(P)H-hydrate epimerase
MLPARRPDAHKGSRGRLLVIAGSRQYPGAAGLVCRAAHRAGAGLVTLACPPPVQPFVAPQSPETTYALLIGEKHLAVPDIRDLKSLADRVSALAIGPGLGTAEATRRAVHLLAGTAIPAVWDADALNALADTDLKPGPSAVITPHPGEAARLLAMETHEVNQDRFSAARRLAAERQCTVVLKGPQSIVADHDGRAVVWPTPVPALATGGSGDVLTGVIGALLAQGCEPFAAAAAGVYLHARAGQRAAETHGDTGVVASDLPPALGVIRQELQLDLPPAGL